MTNLTRRGFLSSAGIATGALMLGLNRVLAVDQPQDTIVVDNLTFYRAVLSAVQYEKKRFEEEIIGPSAKEAVKDADLDTKVDDTIPVEGHYNESATFRQLFFHRRALQIHPTSKTSKAIEKLKDIYDHPVFGSKQVSGTIATPIDPIVLASDKVYSAPHGNIDNIMDRIDPNDLDPLFKLAYMVDNDYKKKTSKWNPLATFLASEKYVSVGSPARFPRRSKKKVIWEDNAVSKEVIEAAKELIDGYNALFEKHNHKGRINYITKDNIGPKVTPALTMLRFINVNTSDKGNYYWAMADEISPGIEIYRVIDVLQKDALTNKDWQNSQTRAEYRNSFDIYTSSK